MTDSDEILKALVDGTAALAPLGGVGDELAGYKGYGYTAVVEILSAALSGGKFMKALTGVSPNEYVIIRKLNKSVELLKEGRMTVSEIAYGLGFSTPSHFSNTFKNRFGVSPRHFLQKQ